MAVFQAKPSQKPHKNFYAYYRKDLTQIRYKRRKPPAVIIYRGNFAPKKFTGKEQDQETGLYYFGARYLDPKTSRWLSTDPALGDYLPVAPNSDDAKKHNQNLPGMGGVFNVINLHVYHYAGNNPVKYVDPDGRLSDNPETEKAIDNLSTQEPKEMDYSHKQIILNSDGYESVSPEEASSIESDLKYQGASETEEYLISSRRETFQVPTGSDIKTDLANGIDDWRRGNNLPARNPRSKPADTYETYTVRVYKVQIIIDGKLVLRRECIDINDDGHIDGVRYPGR